MFYFVVHCVHSTSRACDVYKILHLKKYTFNNMDDGSGRITENRSADICGLPMHNDCSCRRYVKSSQISLLQSLSGGSRTFYKGSMKNS